MPLSTQTSLSIALVLPSSLNSLLPHTTHSHFIFSKCPRRPSPQLSYLFPSLLLKSNEKGGPNEKVMEASSAPRFWEHHTQFQLLPNPQKHWTLQRVYQIFVVAISLRFAEAQGSASSQFKPSLCILGEMSILMIHSKFFNKIIHHTCTMLTRFIYS